MRSCWLYMRSVAVIGPIVVLLSGCDSVLTPFVGQSKEAAAHAVPSAPPGPPPSTAFINDSMLSPGFMGRGAVPPTLPMTPALDDAVEDAPQPSPGPHTVIASVPLSPDPTVLAPLSAAANRESAGSNMRFVLLVLSPPASDGPTLDRNNTAARLAANTAVKVMGDGGIEADRIEISMATSPTAGAGELRLYRR